MFKNIKATIKFYPVKEIQKNQKYWFDGQKLRTISVRIQSKVTEETMKKILAKANEMGYAATDSKTFMKKVSIDNLLIEQCKLREIFDISLAIN